jgi:putative ABC transport system substrate-binding protein
MFGMRRREFMTLLGGAATAWPLAARARQAAIPAIGFLHSGSRLESNRAVQALQEGLAQAGYVENQNLSIEYRWAEGRDERFPEFAVELVRRPVNLIVAIGSPAVAAAKAATTSIPVVFYVGVDPVRFGLVHSLSRPGGNLTGVSNVAVEIGPKRLEILSDLFGPQKIVGILLNPRRARSEVEGTDLLRAAQALRLKAHVVHASTEEDFVPVFRRLVELGASGLAISGDPFFNGRVEHLGALSLRHAVPTIYQSPEFTMAGGLISYGSSFSEQLRLAGGYAGRILKGEKPAELPVQQSSKLELVVNLKTARTLGLEIPPSLLARADEVIE